MKTNSISSGLAVTLLLLLCAWPRTSVAQSTIGYAVVAWGWNEDGEATVPVAAQSGVTAIAAGGAYTAALKDDGTVVAWGSNNSGQTNVPAGLSGVTAI